MPDDAPAKPNSSWPYPGAIPQRFSTNYKRYQELGGLVDIVADARAYAGDEPLWDVERLMFLSLTFDQIHKERLEGDFAELGVYKGHTAAVLARHARRLQRHLYLLDTFEGFDEKDFSGLDAGRKLSFTDTSLDAVRARVGEADTTYIKGFFPQTAEHLPDDGRYCLVHIDTDLYAPIISGLEYFYPRLVPGGFLIVHDYGSLAWAGAEKAVDTFFADKPESVIPIPDSAGSAVIRRQRTGDARRTWIAIQQTLPTDIWHSTENGKLSRVMTEGWSSSEPWGTWGVGSSHQLTLTLDASESRPVAVDLDVHAFVWDTAGRRFDVFVDGQHTMLLTFEKDDGRTTVTLPLPNAAVDAGPLTIEFRPQEVTTPKDVSAASEDPRPLGIALHRIRLRSTDEAAYRPA